MNLIDIILIIIMFLSIWASVQRGFILSALDLLSWTGSLVAGFLIYGPLSSLLLKIIPTLSVWAAPLSFIITVIIIRILFDSIAYSLLQKIPKRMHTQMVNKLFGIIPGAINGFLWMALIAAFLLLMPLTNKVSEGNTESKLAGWLIKKVSWLEDKLYPIFNEALNRDVPNTSPAVSKDELIKLPYTVKNPRRRPELEAEMLIMVNKERTKRGLETLNADPEMAIVANKHSADMFARGYFSHYTPEGIDPFKRMRREKVRFLTAGENLALAQTLLMAHTGLMNSPGHRANILNASFGRLGIGILDGGIYGLMITQNFRN